MISWFFTDAEISLLMQDNQALIKELNEMRELNIKGKLTVLYTGSLAGNFI